VVNGRVLDFFPKEIQKTTVQEIQKTVSLPLLSCLLWKLFPSISTNVCSVTHPCDTKTNPPPPECRNPPFTTDNTLKTPLDDFSLEDVFRHVSWSLEDVLRTRGDKKTSFWTTKNVLLQNQSETFGLLSNQPDRILVWPLDGKTGLLTGLLAGKQGWKCPVALLATCCGSKSLKVILIASDFRAYPVLNPLVTL
jgi:hypothetical protein